MGGTGITNSGTMVASASGYNQTGPSNWEATLSIDGGTLVNAKTIEALATLDGEATVTVFGSSSSNSIGDTSMMLASANGSSEATLSIDGGMVINTKTIQAAASGQGSAFVDLESTSGATNSGTIQAVAGADSVAYRRFIRHDQQHH